LESSVKSAGRVFAVLEFFEEHQRAASALEVAQALNFPQSSTSALMRTMTAHGYLRYDSSRRDYLPTQRVAMLGHWLNPVLFKEGRLFNLMEDLSQRTNETIMLGLRKGLNAQYIHVIQAKVPMRLHVKPGTLRPLGRSGLGHVLLAEYPDKEVKRLVGQLNAIESDPSRQIDVRALLSELSKVRERGYAFSVDQVTPGAGVVAMRLPAVVGTEETLAVCVAGLTEALIVQEKEIADLLRRSIASHLSE
jgi:DNA-binding IclR family transcriptional regulator